MGVSLDGDVLPIFRIRRGHPPEILADAGTGFVIADRVLLTCLHCVTAPLAEQEAYAAAYWNGSRYLVKELSNVSQTATGHDLALASVDLDPQAELRLSGRGLTSGDDVWTFGFPHTRVGLMDHEPPGFRPAPSYELDMATPEGLSGAPLFRMGSLEVVGMVYGTNEVGQIVSMARADPETGERHPEVERIQSFGLAHEGLTLHGAQGAATGGRRLGEIVRLAR